jgi:hypothetical protein
LNIFVLHSDTHLAAAYHCDKHVVKMILESAQMLSTAHHLCGAFISSKLYKKTHENHPCNVWVRQSKQNYQWLHDLFGQLLAEHQYRYSLRTLGKSHKCWELFELLGVTPKNIPDIGLTMWPQCVPDKYKVKDDPIAAYRQFYLGEKSRFAKWKYTDAPKWYTTGDIYFDYTENLRN